MNKEMQAVYDDASTLVEDARALIAATANVAGEDVAEARKRLTAALEKSKELCGRVREKAVDGVNVTDQVVRENPYQAIGIAFGLGALIGCLLPRRCCRTGS